MDLELIQQLIAKLEASKLRKLVVKQGDFELQLEKEGEHPPIHRTIVAENATESALWAESSQKGGRGGHVKPEQPEPEGEYVVSPMVGTFYSSPAPDQPVFVKIGDKVDEGTIVCIIEAMKVMNEVKAGAKGTVAEILADNAQPVEFGTKLLRIT